MVTVEQLTSYFVRKYEYARDTRDTTINVSCGGGSGAGRGDGSGGAEGWVAVDGWGGGRAFGSGSGIGTDEESVDEENYWRWASGRS